MLKSYNTQKIICGCDEAGRGCLAGPVFAAAVILPKKFKNKETYCKNYIKTLLHFI